MIAENKKKIVETLNEIPDEYAVAILEYLNTLQSKKKNRDTDISSMLMAEESLAKEWLSKEEEEAWAHL